MPAALPVSPLTPAQYRTFILEQTTLTTPPVVPEVRLHLVSEVTPLWQATETLLEQANIAPPYWGFAWAGGQAQARYLLDHPDLVAGKRVLDFAAGCGIGAIAAGLAGAAQIDAAEIDPLAIAAIELNAEANGVQVTALLDNVLERTDCPWDVVMAGDVCYERSMAEAVFDWMRRCARSGAVVLMADPGRNYLPLQGLMRLDRMEVPTTVDLESVSSRTTSVYRIVG